MTDGRDERVNEGGSERRREEWIARGAGGLLERCRAVGRLGRDRARRGGSRQEGAGAGAERSSSNGRTAAERASEESQGKRRDQVGNFSTPGIEIR